MIEHIFDKSKIKRQLFYRITDAEEGMSVGTFLKQHGYSRQMIIDLKKTTFGIAVNEEWSYVRTILKKGDVLQITLEEEVGDGIVAKQSDFQILYEDADILVVNKPSGMSIHPSQNHYDNTLANAVAFYMNQKNESITFRCINRLDRDTTGVTIIAKHRLAASVLHKQNIEHRIKKIYLAVCEGKLFSEGTIDARIARREGSTIERRIHEDGEEAITHYKRLLYKKEEDISLAEVRLETGRTHQIRVHFQHIGHPLLGDFLYNPENQKMDRQGLHAYKISFFHPITTEYRTVTAPIPDDIRTLFPQELTELF